MVQPESVCTNPQDAALEILLKEAEFLRAESLQCISLVRKLALVATYTSGFSLPIIASLLTYGYQSPAGAELSGSEIVSLGIEENLEKNGIILQFLCIGVSMSCAALLLIYVGTFKQIFNFAKYFRQVLRPSILEVLGRDQSLPPLFNWEIWLQDQRKKGFVHAGDSDLAVEPILIISYILVFSFFSIFFAYFSEYKDSVIGIAIIAVVLNVLVVVNSIIQFLITLRSSAKN